MRECKDNSLPNECGYGFCSGCRQEIVTDQNFGNAIEHMENKGGIKLPQWKDDVYISIQFPDEHSKMTHRYMYVTSRFGCIPWIPTQVELLSKEWILLNI